MPSKRRKVAKSPLVVENMRAALDANAVAEAKKTVKSLPAIPPRFWQDDDKTRVSPQTFSIIARMVETPEMYCHTFLARVMITLTTVPELPDIVTLEGKVFVLVETAPLTYIQRFSSEATRV